MSGAEAEMVVQRIKTPGIAHNAYLLGTQGIGILVDPRRDIDEYLRAAAEAGLTLRYVLETHRQEDFALGSASVRERLGAQIVAGTHEIFAHADRRLADGERLEIGELAFVALHTPGHTPESVCWAVYMKHSPERCWAVFTGDALFVGETGRTDLPDPARTAENAGLLYDAIHRKILPLGDQAILYPAHGSGSVCGSNIADYDDSTIGFERAYNPVFTLERDAFVERKVHERLPRPPYFAWMEQANLQGGLGEPTGATKIPVLQSADFARASARGIVIDTRLPEAFAGGHVPGAYSVWLAGLPVFGGWIAGRDTEIFLVLERSGDLAVAVNHLARIGLDRIQGVLAGGFEHWRNAGQPTARSGTITPAALRDRPLPVLDVREISEFEDEGHIAGASNVYVGELSARLHAGGPPFDGLDKAQPLVVTCSVGHRASLAASVLLRHGYRDVRNLLGGMKAWKADGLAIERGPRDRTAH